MTSETERALRALLEHINRPTPGRDDDLLPKGCRACFSAHMDQGGDYCEVGRPFGEALRRAGVGWREAVAFIARDRR